MDETQATDLNDIDVGSADAIIAATAVEAGESVVTDDQRDSVHRIRKQAGVPELDDGLHAAD